MVFLTALLAFAAVMALMSTIVAVLIEATINLLGMRSAGLKKLLERYYREAVAPRVPAEAGLRGNGAEARAFASQVTMNPARQAGFWFSGAQRFNRLTVRQLIEQLARTPAGKAYLKMPDDKLKRHLEALAYEFDRFSEGASDFFTRRTRNRSVMIAMVLAFALNIDAVRLYRVLATDPATRERIIEATEAYEARRRAAEIGATRNADFPDRAPSQVDAEDGFASSEQQLDELLTIISSLSIPIGVSQYPFCSSYSPLLGHVAADDPDDRVVFDTRCSRVLDYAPPRRADGRPAPTAAPMTPEPYPFRNALAEWMDAAPQTWFAARVHPDTTLWLFSVLIAGGMIGLGAPFWFNVYRRLGLLIPVVGAISSASTRTQQTQDGESVTTTGAPGRRDDANVTGSENLVVSLRTAAGESPDVDAASSGADSATGGAGAAGGAPPGAAMGAGSAQRVAAATGGAEPSRGIRRLRG
jgi:hypothetical protein